MSDRQRESDLQKYIGRTTRNQRNLVWPDYFVNSRNVDQFLWRGSSGSTKVQRVGAWLFGLTFIGAGSECVHIAVLYGTAMGLLTLGSLGVGSICAGLRICLGGRRKHHERRMLVHSRSQKNPAE
jgi:hypothetical protein